MAVSQCLLHALQLLQAVLAGSTRWVVEPLALVLLLDTLLLTAVGLAYKLITRRRSREGPKAKEAVWKSGSSKVHPGAAVPAEAEEAKGFNAYTSPANKGGMEGLLGCFQRRRGPRCWCSCPCTTSARCTRAPSRRRARWRGPGAGWWSRCWMTARRRTSPGRDARRPYTTGSGVVWTCVYRQRVDRKGFKAGNLREGLTEEYTKDCAYVAVLDADLSRVPTGSCSPFPTWRRTAAWHLYRPAGPSGNQDDCLLSAAAGSGADVALLGESSW